MPKPGFLDQPDNYQTIRLRRSVLVKMDEIITRVNATLPATAKTTRSLVIEAALAAYEATLGPQRKSKPTGEK